MLLYLSVLHPSGSAPAGISDSGSLTLHPFRGRSPLFFPASHTSARGLQVFSLVKRLSLLSDSLAFALFSLG